MSKNSGFVCSPCLFEHCVVAWNNGLFSFRMTATVYRGSRIKDNKPVAIKVVDLTAAPVQVGGMMEIGPNMVQAHLKGIEFELKTLKQSRHTNIIKYLDSFLVEDHELWVSNCFL